MMSNSTMSGAQVAAVFVGTASLLFVLNKKRKTLKDGEAYPPHLWSWIPYIGSAIDLNKSYTRDFVTKNAKKLGSPIFTATIAGNKCVFVADPKFLPALYKEIPQIDSYSLQVQFMAKVFDLTVDQQNEVRNSTVPNGIFKSHMMVKEGLESGMTYAQEIIDRLMKEFIVEWKQNESSSGWTRVPMLDFIKKLIFKASMGALISDALMDDDILNDFCTFEAAVPLLFAGVPKSLCKDGIEARERLINAMKGPIFEAGASGIMKERKEKLAFSSDVEMAARFNASIVFAAVGNSMPGVFWAFCHLLADSTAYAACLEQVEAIAAKREAGRSTFTMDELDEMTLLQSAFMESLRMYQGGCTARDVVGDFVINPREKTGVKYVVEKGSRIMGYPIVAHYDETLFEDPTTFKYDRFVDPKAKAKDGSSLMSHVRPFGGGVHLCLGRKFISFEARAMMAMMMMELDLRMAPDEEVPQIDFEKQGVSVDSPCRDPFFEVRARSLSTTK